MDFPRILIQAVPWFPGRVMNAEFLERVTGGSIIWDEDHNAFTTWMSVLKEAGQDPVVILEDDAILCNGWHELMGSLIERLPNRFIIFHSRSTPYARRGPDYILRDGLRMNGTPGYYLPTGYASEILTYAESWREERLKANPDRLLDYDACMGMWLRARHEEFVVSTPSLVDHAVGVSAIDPRRSVDRSALDFKG